MTAAESPVHRGRSHRFFAVMAMVLLFIGLSAGAYAGWRLVDGLATSSWTEARATVTSAEVLRTDLEAGKSPQHSYRVVAEYTVDGQSYEIRYQTNLQRAEVRVGDTTLVRYDPDDHADARRGASGVDVVAPLVLGVLGIALVVGGALLLRRSRRGPITLPSFRATRTVSRRFGSGGDAR